MIVKRIYQWACTQPDKTALIYNGVPMSYAQYARAIAAVRNVCERQILPAGQTAIILANSIADAWLMVMALRSLGLNTLCMPSMAVAEALNIRDVACIAVMQSDKETLLASHASGALRVVAVPPVFPGKRGSDDLPHWPDGAPPFGNHILYTSGTTGTYKKVLWEAATEERRFERRIPFPPYAKFKIDTVFHAAAFGLWTVLSMWSGLIWHLGGTVVIDQRPQRYREFFRYGVNATNIVSPIVRAVLQYRDISPPPTADFQMMMSGGFVPLALVEQIRDRLTNEVWISYGSTECSLPAYSRFRTAEDLIWLTPSPDRTVEIVDEGGNLLGPDQPGDLRIPLVDYDAHSYLDDEEATQRFFRDGCFYPGDMAVWRSDGRIRILGRSADVVNIQGMKVPVAPLEQEAQQKLGVETVCIFGGMDDDGQEVLMVAMETDKLPPRAAMEQVAAGFKTFKQVQFRVVKQFPRTVTGLQKIKRIELRQMVFGEQFVRH